MRSFDSTRGVNTFASPSLSPLFSSVRSDLIFFIHASRAPNFIPNVTNFSPSNSIGFDCCGFNGGGAGESWRWEP
ncbi:hypothetical protein L1987_75588 [Smallanthus sonchifolius]|uniref:Uncharacterized protein n=1 Tax=Smallanthus sonchifolius TaxID=185202 RepID=A0ACB9A565_9ASTR|nr:hypothetical protein L1987_75588 [Smallanthus sonchifolius]